MIILLLSLLSSYPFCMASAAEAPPAVSTAADLSADPQQGLAAALRATMVHNPAVKGKRAEVQARQYGIDSAEAERYPSLSGQANNLNEDREQLTVRVQQPLWTFGKISTDIEQAQAQYGAERWGLLQVRRQLLEEVAATYAKVLGVRKREAVAESNIAEHQRLYQRILRRQQGQLASEADVRFAYSRLIQARSQRERIRGELDVALTDLLALTQVQVPARLPIDPPLTALPGLAQVEDMAMENSADVGLKRATLSVVRLEIKKERAAPMPTLSIRVEHEVLDTPDYLDDTRAGLVLEGNLSGLGLVSRGRIKGASARLNAAQQDLSSTLIEVRRRVDTLMLDRKVQAQLKRSQVEAVEAVEGTMASFMRQYESGRKTWVDVLNTQRELTELRYQLARIETDWLILSLRVAALIGHLDQLAGIEAI